MKIETLYIYRPPFGFQTLLQVVRFFLQLMRPGTRKPCEPVVFVIFPQRKLTVTEQAATNFIFQAPSQRVALSQVFVAGVASDSRDIAAQVHDLIFGRSLF